MQLYRVLPWNAQAKDREPGGALYIPRKQQGSQRHDIPHLDGVLYCSCVGISAVTETIAHFSGFPLSQEDLLTHTGVPYSLVEYELSDDLPIVDLDSPKSLVKFNIKPSRLTTKIYAETRLISEMLYKENIPGFLWPSSYEATWTNATLFETRIIKHIKIIKDKIQPLTTKHPLVQQACKNLRMKIED